MTRAAVPSLRLIVIAMAVALVVGLTFAAVARAADGDMPGMDMSGATAEQDGGHDGMAGMPGMDGSGVSTNWLVVGGFLALIAGGTAAAVVVKRRLRDQMLAGELATAGVLDA